MADLLQFPGGRVTPADLMAVIQAAIDAGEVQHMLVVTMGPDTSVNHGLTTSPANLLVYMNQWQRLKIEGLMRDGGMIP